MKKISIIIPVYNTEKYLRKCLDSLVRQTYYDFTAIIINDGSTDHSLDILKEYDNKYPSMFKIYNIPNGGRANARNVGLEKVKTEYCMFLDSDDYLDDETLYSLMYNMDKDIDIIAFNGKRIIKNTDGSVYKCLNNNSDDLVKSLIISSPGPGGKLYRTSLFKDNNLYFPKDIKLYEDLGLMPIVASYAKKIKYIDKAFYNYVIREGSAMRQTSLNDDMQDIFKIMEILSKNINKKFSMELEYLYIENLLRSASLRYSMYKEGYKYIDKISDIMHKKYPHYNKNIYYKKKNIRFKLVCYLAYHKKYKLLKILNNLNKKRLGY